MRRANARFKRGCKPHPETEACLSPSVSGQNAPATAPKIATEDAICATPMMSCQTGEPPTIFSGTKIVSPGCIRTFLKPPLIQMLPASLGTTTDPSTRST